MPSGLKARIQAGAALLALAAGVAFAADGAGSWRQRLDELRKSRAADVGAKAPAKAADAAKAEYPWATPDDTHYIDTMLQEEWSALGFAIAAPCTDGEFLRRAALDVIGRIPTLAELETFQRDKAATRRANAVNRLLASPEYGKNWANIWTHLMITGGNAGGANQDVNPDALRGWLEQQFNKGTGWDKIVSELISAQGRWDENPAVNYVIANTQGANAIQLTSSCTKLFLCVQTQCTECHDHPWNEWKQDQFHGIRAFFGTTRERRVVKTTAAGQAATDYYELNEMPVTAAEIANRAGTNFERRNGMVSYVMPTYIDGRDANALARGEKHKPKDAAPRQAAELTPDEFIAKSRQSNDQPLYLRKELAKAMTADDNPHFARAVVNRLWHHYLGHSFIKNVDDFDNGQDEPSMPELLDKLARDFKTHKYDLKRLTRWICSSRAYGLSSKHKGKPNKDAEGFFTTMLVKPMTPDQLYDSALTLTDLHHASKSQNSQADRQRFLTEFRRTFGTADEATAAPKFNGTITQSLMLMNSAIAREACSCKPGSFLHKVAAGGGGLQEKVGALYSAALSRKPTGGELHLLGQLQSHAHSEPEFLEDVMWLLLNSGEFMLND